LQNQKFATSGEVICQHQQCKNSMNWLVTLLLRALQKHILSKRIHKLPTYWPHTSHWPPTILIIAILRSLAFRNFQNRTSIKEIELAMYIIKFGFMGFCGPSKMHEGKVRWKPHFAKLLSSIEWATMPTILQIFLCKLYQKKFVISKNQHRARIGE